MLKNRIYKNFDRLQYVELIPTIVDFSGLDNVSTLHTLKLLRRLAHQGRTIVCTIHQPSASLFQLFDSVYVLSRGQCVYQGATDQLVSFLASTGFYCPTHYNPADFGKLFFFSF